VRSEQEGTITRNMGFNTALLLQRYTKETPGENIGTIFQIHRTSVFRQFVIEMDLVVRFLLQSPVLSVKRNLLKIHVFWA